MLPLPSDPAAAHAARPTSQGPAPSSHEEHLLRVRPSLILVVFVLALLAPPLTALPALAGGDGGGGGDEVTIDVKLIDRTVEGDPQPVPDVTIAVVDSEGAPVGEEVTDAEGVASIPVPGGDTYTVQIDTDTLPEGTELTNPDDVEAEVQNLGFSQTVQFPIGPAPEEDTRLDRLPDLLLSGVKFGLLIALAALGLSMVFGTTGLTNFSHGELVTFGAIVAWWLNRDGNLPVIWAGALAVVVAMVAGYLQDRGFWRPLRERGTGNVALMIVSIGIGLFLRNVFQYLFGDGFESYDQYVDQGPLDWGILQPTPKDLVIIGTSIVVLVLVSLALARTRTGKATRAVADNPALAASSGINVNRVISVVWIGGTALAGLSGVLLGLDQQVDYQMGFRILLLVFAGVTLGGLGTIWGAMVGSMIVGLLIEVSTLYVPAELKYVGALVVLILILLVKPQGILGRRERIG